MLNIGFENKKIIIQLVVILGVKNPNMIRALITYYCDCTIRPKDAHNNEGIPSGNFYNMVKRVNKLVDEIEKLQKIRLGLL